jgi:hypothetical protein
MSPGKLSPIAWPVFLALSASIHISAQAKEFEHSWFEAKFTPCEGVGVHGTFRVKVGGAATAGADGSQIVSALRVHASSGAFTQNEGSIGASALVKVGGAVKEKLVLTRPAPPSVEAAQKPDETRKVYLAQGKTLTIPKGGELWVLASPIIKTSAGTCSLGSSESKIPLP